MAFESVEASLVMLGDKPALVARPLPRRITDEDVETGNGVVMLKGKTPDAKIEAIYYYNAVAKWYYKNDHC